MILIPSHQVDDNNDRGDKDDHDNKNDDVVIVM